MNFNITIAEFAKKYGVAETIMVFLLAGFIAYNLSQWKYEFHFKAVKKGLSSDVTK